MKMKITSEVFLDGMRITDEYVQEFDDNENVFGRVLKYHKRMEKVFPKCEYRLIKSKRVGG